MKFVRRLSAFTSLLFAIVMVVTACGGSDEATATSAPATSGPTATRAAGSTSTVVPPTAPALPAATSRPAPTPQPTSPAVPAGERVTRGGIYAVRIIGDHASTPTGWDPHQASGHVHLKVIPNIFNNLLMLDKLSPTTIKGDLAQSWTISPDGLAYTIKLIPGVKFTDGSPLTSKDVIF